MDNKLFDSELKVMDVLWREGDTPAKEIAKTLSQEECKHHLHPYQALHKKGRCCAQ